MVTVSAGRVRWSSHGEPKICNKARRRFQRPANLTHEMNSAFAKTFIDRYRYRYTTCISTPMCHWEEPFSAQVRRKLSLKHRRQDWFGSKRVGDSESFHGVRYHIAGQLNCLRHRQAIVWQGYTTAEAGWAEKGEWERAEEVFDKPVVRRSMNRTKCS